MFPPRLWRVQLKCTDALRTRGYDVQPIYFCSVIPSAVEGSPDFATPVRDCSLRLAQLTKCFIIVLMDPNNPIARLCVEGMSRESEGRPNEAFALFMRAWEQSANDFERCIAAHYVARHQPSPADALHWNLKALDLAEAALNKGTDDLRTNTDAATDVEIQNFFPSLYLNLGKSYEETGAPHLARKSYELAAEKINSLPPSPYKDIVSDGITRGMQRVAALG